MKNQPKSPKSPKSPKLSYKIIEGGNRSPINPRVSAFVYPRVGKAIVLHGKKDIVTHYILREYPVSLVHFLIKKKRMSWDLPVEHSWKWVEVFGISRRFRCVVINNELVLRGSGPHCKKLRRDTFKIVDRSMNSGKRGQIVATFRVRQFPRSWMTELDPYIDTAHIVSSIPDDFGNEQNEKVYSEWANAILTQIPDDPDDENPEKTEKTEKTENDKEMVDMGEHMCMLKVDWENLINIFTNMPIDSSDYDKYSILKNMPIDSSDYDKK